MNATDSKVLAVLASTTHEGEAINAWRALRKRKPHGALFTGAAGPAGGAGTVDVAQAYQRGLALGRRAALEDLLSHPSKGAVAGALVERGREEGYRNGYRSGVKDAEERRRGRWRAIVRTAFWLWIGWLVLRAIQGG